MQGTKKTLVLREIPENRVKRLLSNKEYLADCDIAVFVHDSSDENSWKRATELLVEVASHGEGSGFEVPCLIIAAKDDLDPYPMAIQDSTRLSEKHKREAKLKREGCYGALHGPAAAMGFYRIAMGALHGAAMSADVSQNMGIEAPIPVSLKLGDLNNVFRRIVSVAEHPHLSIPETEAGRNRKQYHRLVNRSLMFVSVGAAVAIVGLAAYRVYAARKNISS
ncbi:hypothetical protein HHK36_012613 [Tetracentron sinense]|uniref:Uncharacterized protein n=1 Tax=Tetracentron sinense TaxID=13715 RepID=A0A834Z8M6_TETSI|nr:hypothetical protein HHK36_012613 [Tetracentron sinense]